MELSNKRLYEKAVSNIKGVLSVETQYSAYSALKPNQYDIRIIIIAKGKDLENLWWEKWFSYTFFMVTKLEPKTIEDTIIEEAQKEIEFRRREERKEAIEEH